MPFDPALPADGARILAAELRAQFTALKALIDNLTPPAKGGCESVVKGDDNLIVLVNLLPLESSTFDIALRGPGMLGYELLAASAPAGNFTFPPLPPGDYAALVAGRVPAGAGEWSDPIPFTVE